MNPLNPTDRLTVELEAQQWNQVLGLLAGGFAQLMQTMQTQLQNPRDLERVTPFSREAS